MRDSDLDDLFAEARTRAPAPSEALMARVLADAATHQPRPAAAPVRVARPSSGWSSWFAGLRGGALAGAGMMTATLAGVWIGFAQPSSMVSVTDALWQGAVQQIDVVELQPSLDLFPSLDGFMSEG
ncbi:dihydroorotate dehydrogenase [Cereibacter changlensis JA139]|uniref:Dihydroorotate dehydrogenase n=2 Tax=Cereibacter changlensis TaxID=402884 RepID=A0A2T4JSN6_9RHOB|nr:dihydroorotate dehydrogenase [Cereibacter changlensis]PTE20914.1 dihydroorotate dehydrogenase [Cereibacter changlensis JA139]PZX53677.1 hypothetical protein LX76_02316 [Cereibacter changlensis]